MTEVNRELEFLRSPRGQRQLRIFWKIWGPKKAPFERPRFSKLIVASLVSDAGGRCTYCHTAFVCETNHPQQPTVDHVTPLASGGTDARENLTAACRTCNQRKGARNADDFRATIGSEDVS